ncbi:hypothetical protein INT48_000840 [Thamnidium elegans]|uniref:Uncharacterized protein n=1 Tax=Thamnidium elegans TaxID=101142 RepID=A0A8H7VX63_9FUNG|nr:hypothetical protein INT48_000840 [Thamnidium elegans]
MEDEKFTVAGEVKKCVIDLSGKSELALDDYTMFEIKKDLLVLYEGIIVGCAKNKNKTSADVSGSERR